MTTIAVLILAAGAAGILTFLGMTVLGKRADRRRLEAFYEWKDGTDD